MNECTNKWKKIICCVILPFHMLADKNYQTDWLIDQQVVVEFCVATNTEARQSAIHWLMLWVVASHRLRRENARGDPTTRRPPRDCRWSTMCIVAIAVTFIVHGNERWKPAVSPSLILLSLAQPYQSLMTTDRSRRWHSTPWQNNYKTHKCNLCRSWHQ